MSIFLVLAMMAVSSGAGNVSTAPNLASFGTTSLYLIADMEAASPIITSNVPVANHALSSLGACPTIVSEAYHIHCPRSTVTSRDRETLGKLGERMITDLPLTSTPASSTLDQTSLRDGVTCIQNFKTCTVLAGSASPVPNAAIGRANFLGYEMRRGGPKHAGMHVHHLRNSGPTITTEPSPGPSSSSSGVLQPPARASVKPSGTSSAPNRCPSGQSACLVDGDGKVVDPAEFASIQSSGPENNGDAHVPTYLYIALGITVPLVLGFSAWLGWIIHRKGTGEHGHDGIDGFKADPMYDGCCSVSCGCCEGC